MKTIVRRKSIFGRNVFNIKVERFRINSSKLFRVSFSGKYILQGEDNENFTDKDLFTHIIKKLYNKYYLYIPPEKK